MNDDLAADAATWVPPWQRPAPSPDTATDSADDDADSDPPAVSPDGAPDAHGDDDPDRDDGSFGDDGSLGDDDSSGERAGTGLPEHWAGLTGARWVEPGSFQAVEDAEEVSHAPTSDEPTKELEHVSGVESGEDEAAQGPAADEPTQESEHVSGAGPGEGEPEASTQERGEGLGDAAEGLVRALAAGGWPGGQPEQASADQLPAGLASEPVELSETELIAALEAILMVVDEPVSEITLSQVLETPAERIAGALIDLSAAYTREGRGFDLRRAAGGWRFYTRADYSSYVEKFILDGQQLRLTQASLETLAVVAYKQPVTRSRISAIRGVNCDGVIRTLVTRGMVEECGTDPDSGAHLYRTTTLFLEKLGLDSVEQLPPLAPFLPDNLDEVTND